MNNNTIVVSEMDIDFKEQLQFGITESHSDAIVSAANNIILGDATSAHNFGRQTNGNATYLDDLLANVMVFDQGQSGKKLNEIVDLARIISGSVQPGRFQLFLNKLPLIGNLIGRTLRMQRRALDRFDSVKNQVDILTTDITAISAGFRQQNATLAAMYEEVLQEARDTGVNIVAAELAINHIDTELVARREQLRREPENSLLAMEISDIEHQFTILKKRRADMIVAQQKGYDDLTMIKMMQHNNLTMIDKFADIEAVTLPAAKRAHLLVDQADKTNSGALLAQAIGETTNSLARRQADLVRESSLRTAQQSVSTVYDEKTLEHIATTMNNTIRDVQKIRKESENHHVQLALRAKVWTENRRQMLLHASTD